MRATYSPSTFGMHHMSLLPGLEAVFGQPPAHRLARETLVVGKLDHRVGQKLQRPAGATFGRVCASRGDEQGFLLARRACAAAPGRGSSLSARSEIAFNEATLGPVNGGAADSQRCAQSLHRCGRLSAASKIWARLSLAGGMFAAAYRSGEFTALGFAQFDMITYIHLGSPRELRGPDESDK